MKENRVAKVMNQVFDDWSMISNYKFSRLGRVGVVWKKQLRVQVVFKSGQLITCSFQLPNIDEDFLCSFVYASNFADERTELWRDLKTQHDHANFKGMPWIVFGDFNETLDFEEHSNSDISPSITPGMRDFQNIVRYCSFVDMRTHGPLFTWCNRRNEGLICKKLDRVLQNIDWSRFFPHSYCVLDSGGCSDHLRGKIFLSSDFQKPRGPFKFTNILASQPEFTERVLNYWQASPALFHSTSSLFRFSKKLKQLKPILRIMSRQKLSDITRKSAEAYEDLCSKQLSTLSNPTTQEIVAES